MPVQLGQKPLADFTQPLAMLSECHRRIEKFLDILAHLADASVPSPRSAGERPGEGSSPSISNLKSAISDPPSPLPPEQAQALDTALRYFRAAAPLHTQDEEVSLFPRLRALGDGRAQAALATVAALERDHRAAQSAHDRLDELGRRWLATGRLAPAVQQEFARLVQQLRDLYQPHIALEDQELFPLAGQVLPPDQLAHLGREMADRRGLEVGVTVSRCAARRR